MELINLMLMSVNLLLTLGLCVLMVALFRQQQERIALMETRIAHLEQHRGGPIFVDGTNRLLTAPIRCFTTNAGTFEPFDSRDLKRLNLGLEQAGTKFKLYAVAEG